MWLMLEMTEEGRKLGSLADHDELPVCCGYEKAKVVPGYIRHDISCKNKEVPVQWQFPFKIVCVVLV